MMTIGLTLALIVLVFIYPEQYAETFRNAVTMVVTFYFAHQREKGDTVWETSQNTLTSQNSNAPAADESSSTNPSSSV